MALPETGLHAHSHTRLDAQECHKHTHGQQLLLEDLLSWKTEGIKWKVG